MNSQEFTLTALVCEEDAVAKTKISEALNALQYNVESAESKDQAFEMTRFNVYDLIVVSERFSGSQNTKDNEFLRHLQYMPMVTRRRIFVILTGDSFNTADNLKAYELSVNLVLNRKDIDNFKIIVKKAIDDHARFYKVYFESLAKYGKA